MMYVDSLILAVWVAFWAYWLFSAIGAKRSIVTNVGRGLFLRLIFIIVVATVVREFNIHVNDQSFMAQQTNPALAAIGFVLILAGLSFAIWARVNIGRSWGMPMSQVQDTKLVTSGPYRFVRHPIYTGIIVGLLGNVVALDLYWLVAFLVAGVYFVYSATNEEKHMATLFPKEYPSYKKRTKMLIPFVF